MQNDLQYPKRQVPPARQIDPTRSSHRQRPQPPQPNRIRSIHGSFSWIDHRFLRQGFDQGLTRLEKLLYLVLIAVSNRDGVSFFVPVSIPLRSLSSPVRLRFARLGRRPPHHWGLLSRAAQLVHSALEVPQGSSDSDWRPGSLQSRVPPRITPTPVRNSSPGTSLPLPARAPSLYPAYGQPLFSNRDAASRNLPPPGHLS